MRKGELGEHIHSHTHTRTRTRTHPRSPRHTTTSRTVRVYRSLSLPCKLEKMPGVFMYVCAWVYACVCVRACVYVPMCLYVVVHVCMRASLPVAMHSWLDVDIIVF